MPALSQPLLYDFIKSGSASQALRNKEEKFNPNGWNLIKSKRRKTI
jgi:hypothetical protein